jgi:hypothetical protein
MKIVISLIKKCSSKINFGFCNDTLNYCPLTHIALEKPVIAKIKI